MRAASLVVGVILLMAGVLACGSDEEPPPPPPDSGVLLTFVTHPAGSTGGRVLWPSIVVEIRDGANRRVANSTRTVRMRIAANSGDPDATLAGTLVVKAVNGRAVFSDLTIDRAADGYRLEAVSSGIQKAQSNAFSIAIGPPELLTFEVQPPDGILNTPLATEIVVRLRDLGGNPITQSTNWVTCSIASDPGSQLLHWSQRTLDLVELRSGQQGTRLDNEASAEGLALTLDPSGVFAWGTSANLWLNIFNLQSGAETPIAYTGLLITGLSFDATGALHAVSRDAPDLYALDTATGAVTSLGAVTIAGDTIVGYTALARDPLTDTVYAVVELASSGGTRPSNRLVRHLVTIDPLAATATMIGQLPEAGVADLAFDPKGQLFAVTGDGAPVPETLFRLDKATAAMVGHVVLGAGIDGEAIAWIPTQLSGTVSAPLIGGVAKFTNLIVSSVGGGFTLRAKSDGGALGESAPFKVLP